MCFEGFGRGTSGYRLQDWRLHFNEAPFLEEAPGFANNGDPFFEHRARTFVGEKIKITLPVTRFDVLEPVPFFRERPQRLGEQLECLDFYCWFPAFGDKTCPFNANEIAYVEQPKKIDQFRPNLLCVNVNLNAAGDVTQVEKMAFPHVAMRRDAAGDTTRFSFFKLLAHLSDRAAHIKACAKRFDAFRAQRLKFFLSERDQLVFVFHIRTANLKPREKMNSPMLLGLPTKHLQ